MIKETEVIATFHDYDFSPYRLPMIVIYDRPIDCPTKFVARLFDLETPTPYAAIANTLDDVRKQLPMRFTRLDAFESDDPVIVEVWI